MDFYIIRERLMKDGVTRVYPDFQVGRSRDIMVRGKAFRAIWDETKGLWSTDEYDVCRLVDQELLAYAQEASKRINGPIQVLYMSDFSSNTWVSYRKWLNHISDNAYDLDNNLTFADDPVRKESYSTRRLPYAMQPGSTESYEEIISTLYDPEEREKIEWSIGAVLSGDARYLHKFVVFFGKPGTGKSTVMNIIAKLFEGYTATFEAKALVSGSDAFATGVFKDNPLVAIQQDGDLSRIEDNTKLNSIVAHEEIIINEKFKPSYPARINAFLYLGTNKPVKITDAQSGLIRRLIDVMPSGRLIPSARYHVLTAGVNAELGAIAHHCLEVYRNLGRNYYAGYKPVNMMFKTDIFYNFVEDCLFELSGDGGITLARAYDLYKEFCDSSNIDRKLPKYQFREELKLYYDEYSDRARVGGSQVRGLYTGFKYDMLGQGDRTAEPSHALRLTMESNTSLLDKYLARCKAQYASAQKTPIASWDNVTSELASIDTSRLHYVRPPANHIVIDFDLRDDNGEKDLQRSIEAASKWPPTYAEISQGGGGVHLHYIYQGDPTELSALYDDHIEIKTFSGKASLRRRLSLCNDTPIATISEGLPKKEKPMLNTARVRSEKSLRELIMRNVRKEIHPGTKPSVEFIKKILDDAHKDGLVYDLSDMRNTVMSFAMNSTHHGPYCLKLVAEMKFQSESVDEEDQPIVGYPSGDLVYFDCEVFPNLFLVNWKVEGRERIVRMINPSPEDIEALCEMKLVGYNCRKYDNHILYARYLGYDNYQLYLLSQRLVNNAVEAGFGEAYNLSYADIYDLAATKMSLKKWEVELGITHKELGLPWDQPVPEERWIEVSEYCDNDVHALEAVKNHLQADWDAREMLAHLSGLTINHTTKAHVAKILFGDAQQPNKDFVYTDLSEMFPGYTFDFGKSEYRGEDPGEGGYVYAEPGMYEDIMLLDVASMHPTSIIQLNLFGPYTQRYADILQARLAIKHHEFDQLDTLLDGSLKPYVQDESRVDALSYAIKIILNTVYGLTIARYPNKFVDPRNKDNIVAKRGALFMIDLKHYLQELGYKVVHIKTDSVKIANADDKVEGLVKEFGAKYGYTFECEAVYDRLCLVNQAVYIAHDAKGWHATGAQFKHPYVFKTLFSGEEITFDDLRETRSVTTALYLGDPNSEADRVFVGRTGAFVPVSAEAGGKELLREKDGKFYSAGGSKGYLWAEADVVRQLGREDQVDMRYYNALVSEALSTISTFGDPEAFRGVTA